MATYEELMNETLGIEFPINEANMEQRIESKYVGLYEHMLKYQYNKARQTPSWIESIVKQRDQIVDDLKRAQPSEIKRIKDINMQRKLFNKGAAKARKDNNSIPADAVLYDQENLLNIAYIENFLNTYARDEYIRDKIYDYI